VQTVLISRTHPSLPPVEKSYPSLPRRQDPYCTAAGATCSARGQIKASTMKGKAKLQTMSQMCSFSLIRCKTLVKNSKIPLSMKQREQSTWKRDSSHLLSLEGAGNHSSLQPNPLSPREHIKDLEVPISALSPKGISSPAQVLISRAATALQEDLSINTEVY